RGDDGPDHPGRRELDLTHALGGAVDGGDPAMWQLLWHGGPDGGGNRRQRHCDRTSGFGPRVTASRTRPLATMLRANERDQPPSWKPMLGDPMCRPAFVCAASKPPPRNAHIDFDHISTQFPDGF